jgi:hypothetical protein
MAFNELTKSHDPIELTALKRLLKNVTMPELRARIYSSFRNEKNLERRRALAWILGSNWEHAEIRPHLADLLSDNDPAIVAEALCRFKLTDLGESESISSIGYLLHAAAEPDKPKDLRVSALRALRGSHRIEDLTFLAYTLQRESNPEALLEAIAGIPAGRLSSIAGLTGLRQSLVWLLHSIATDRTQQPGVRSMAARQALLGSMGTDIFTSREMNLLEGIQWTD